MTVVLLFTTLLRRGHWIWDKALASRIIRLLISAAIMAGVVQVASTYVGGYLQPATPVLKQVPVLLGLIGLSMLVYFASAFAIGGADFGMLRRSLKRGAAKPTLPTDDGA